VVVALVSPLVVEVSPFSSSLAVVVVVAVVDAVPLKGYWLTRMPVPVSLLHSRYECVV
jgi:hypothetical protein